MKQCQTKQLLSPQLPPKSSQNGKRLFSLHRFSPTKRKLKAASKKVNKSGSAVPYADQLKFNTISYREQRISATTVTTSNTGMYTYVHIGKCSYHTEFSFHYLSLYIRVSAYIIYCVENLKHATCTVIRTCVHTTTVEDQPWYAPVSRDIAEYRLKHCNKVYI